MSDEIFTIRTEGEFESAHSIRNYIEQDDGTFIDEPIHGHTWKVEAFVSSKSINERTGFAVDFLDIKKKIDELCEYLDHKFVNDLSPFNEINPSTENISKWFFENIKKIVPSGSFLEKIVVWEGPHNYVEYRQLNKLNQY